MAERRAFPGKGRPGERCGTLSRVPFRAAEGRGGQTPDKSAFRAAFGEEIA